MQSLRLAMLPEPVLQCKEVSDKAVVRGGAPWQARGGTQQLCPLLPITVKWKLVFHCVLRRARGGGGGGAK